jgi:hypothetical protein
MKIVGSFGSKWSHAKPGSTFPSNIINNANKVAFLALNDSLLYVSVTLIDS